MEFFKAVKAGLFIGVIAIAVLIGFDHFAVTRISAPDPMKQTVQGLVMRMPPFQRSVLTAGSTTTVGASLNVADYQLIGFAIATTGLSSTIKVACSMQDNAPDFSSTASGTNQWDYAKTVDLQTGNSITGSTGIAFSNSTTIRQVAVQNSMFRWCTVNQSSWTTGTSTVQLLPATNQ